VENPFAGFKKNFINEKQYKHLESGKYYIPEKISDINNCAEMVEDILALLRNARYRIPYLEGGNHHPTDFKVIIGKNLDTWTIFAEDLKAASLGGWLVANRRVILSVTLITKDDKPTGFKCSLNTVTQTGEQKRIEKLSDYSKDGLIATLIKLHEDVPSFWPYEDWVAWRNYRDQVSSLDMK